MKRNFIIILISSLAVGGLCTLAAAKSLATIDSRRVAEHNRIIEEQARDYETLSEQYGIIMAECETRLGEIQTQMDKAHNLAEASRAMISAINGGVFEVPFTQPQN